MHAHWHVPAPNGSRFCSQSPQPQRSAGGEWGRGWVFLLLPPWGDASLPESSRHLRRLLPQLAPGPPAPRTHHTCSWERPTDGQDEGPGRVSASPRLFLLQVPSSSRHRGQLWGVLCGDLCRAACARRPGGVCATQAPAHVCSWGHGRVGARERVAEGRVRVRGRSPEGFPLRGAKVIPRPRCFQTQVPSHLGGSEVKGHVKQVGLLPGAVSPQDVIGVLHRVHENHHLQGPQTGRLSHGNPRPTLTSLLLTQDTGQEWEGPEARGPWPGPARGPRAGQPQAWLCLHQLSGSGLDTWPQMPTREASLRTGSAPKEPRAHGAPGHQTQSPSSNCKTTPHAPQPGAPGPSPLYPRQSKTKA